MPELSRFFGIIVRMYVEGGGPHHLPHFHAYYHNDVAVIGLDPIEKPIPIRPVAHYSMGGIHTDIRGRTPLENVWAAGEAACVSIHGANRLGTNSTAECLLWGRVTGEDAARYCAKATIADAPTTTAQAEEQRLNELMTKSGRENHAQNA